MAAMSGERSGGAVGHEGLPALLEGLDPVLHCVARAPCAAPGPSGRHDAEPDRHVEGVSWRVFERSGGFVGAMAACLRAWLWTDRLQAYGGVQTIASTRRPTLPVESAPAATKFDGHRGFRPSTCRAPRPTRRDGRATRIRRSRRPRSWRWWWPTSRVRGSRSACSRWPPRTTRTCPSWSSTPPATPRRSRGRITARVAAVDPDAYVRRLDGNRGFGPAANEVLSARSRARRSTSSATTTSRLAPGADPGDGRGGVPVQRRNRRPRRWSSGTTRAGCCTSARRRTRPGVRAPIVERGELDQEQHDAVRDVFCAPGGCTLVRADLFAVLGGFDPAMELLGEDLDLSWRAQVAGARVVAVPAAVVRHVEASDRSEADSRTIGCSSTGIASARC